MTLPAAAVRAPAAVDRYLLYPRPGCGKREMGQTDGRTPDRYTDPAPHTMRAASTTSVRFNHTCSGKYHKLYKLIINNFINYKSCLS